MRITSCLVGDHAQMMSTERERGREEGHKILTIRELKVNLVLTGTDRLGGVLKIWLTSY